MYDDLYNIIIRGTMYTQALYITYNTHKYTFWNTENN